MTTWHAFIDHDIIHAVPVGREAKGQAGDPTLGKSGKLQTAVELICDRCLEPFAATVDIALQMEVETKSE